MGIEQPELVSQDFGKALAKLYGAVAAAFYFCSGEFDAAFKSLHHGIVVESFAVGGEYRIVILSSSWHYYFLRHRRA